MTPLLWLGLKSFFLALLLTPIFRDIFRSYKVVDQPDEGRKVHKHPIPRVGGIAIALSYIAAFLIDFRGENELVDQKLTLAWNLIPGAAVIFAVGLIDDFLGLKPWQKLAGQLAGAVLAYWNGVRMMFVGGYEVADWVAFPITIFWLLACTNAFNLVDGLDGLAAGMGLFATLTTFVAAVVQGNDALAMATLPLAGCLLGFLCYNFNPATIFLGDSGSLLIGFLLGCYGVLWTHKMATVLGMMAPLMVMAIPLTDVTLCIVRRALRRRPIFGADRGHIHHRLLDRGLTPRRAVLVLYTVCGLAAGLSLLQVTFAGRFAAWGMLLFCIIAWVGIHYLGYAEFGLASRLLFGGEFQRAVDAQLCLQTLDRSLSSAKTVEECWAALRQAAVTLGYSHVRLYVAGQSLEEELGGCDQMRWRMRVPLSETDYAEVSCELQSASLPTMVAPLAEVLYRHLGAKASAAGAQATATPVWLQ
jgi:UDP-GlcNAc:undecaprenyl-phosphate GlcNAc-1-phosphate transferase